MPDPQWDVRFSGSALVAGRKLNVALFLKGGNLSVVVLDRIPELQVSALFDHFFAPDLNWPTEIIDLTLADSSLFYAYVPSKDFPPTVPPAILARQTKEPGLFVATTISLSLAGYDLPPLAAQITSVKGKGFIIEGDLTEPVALFDRDFLLLSGPKYQGGPSLSLQSFDAPGGAARQFRLNCTYTLFGKRFGGSELTVSNDAGGKPPKLRAKLQYDGMVGPFKDPKLEFTWSKDEGFRIQDFPRLVILGALLNFAELLKEISKKKDCGEMVDLVLREIGLETGFYVTPKVSSTKPAGSAAHDGQLYVLINGYYKISVQRTLVATVDLPQLVLSLSAPKEFSFEGIAAKIGQTIADNGVAVVEQLWNDRVQLAKFLAVFVTKEVMQKVFAKMACEALKKMFQEFISALGEAALETIGTAIAAGGGAAAATGGCGGGKDDDGKGDGGGGGGGDGGGRAAALRAPSITGRSYASNEVSVGWNGVDGADGYETQVTDSNRQLVGPVRRHEKGARSAALAVAPSTVATGACLVRVKALAPGHGDRTDSDFASASLVKLARPLNVTVSCDATGEVLTARWDAVSYATKYEVLVRHVATRKMVLVTTLTPTQSDGTLTQGLDAAQFWSREPGDYGVRVRALGGETTIEGDWTDAAPLLPRLAPPSWVAQQVLEDRLLVTWPAAPGVTAYQVLVINVDAKVAAVRAVVEVPAGSPGQLQQELRFEEFTVKSAGQHRALVVALGNATHIAGAAAEGPRDVLLFAGVGFTQIGTTFKVS